MELLSLIALGLLTIVGYSGGAVVGMGRRRESRPRLWDVVAAVGVFAAVVMFRDSLGKWTAIAVGVVGGVLVALVLTSGHGRGNVRERPGPVVRERADGSALRVLMERWKAFAARMGNYQGRMMMALIYFGVVTPFGIISRVFLDPLRIAARTEASHWVDRSPEEHDIPDAHRQF